MIYIMILYYLNFGCHGNQHGCHGNQIHTRYVLSRVLLVMTHLYRSLSKFSRSAMRFLVCRLKSEVLTKSLLF